ncbi:MAG: hypothetical protein QXW47_05450 [Candidatus Jordarchaeales archaeon]
MGEYELLMRRARRFYETALMQLERGFNGLSRIQLGGVVAVVSQS